MRILYHLSGFAISICLFLLGHLIIRRRLQFAGALQQSPARRQRLCKLFLLSGGAFEVVASIGGLLEGVAILVLTSGEVVNFFMELGDVI